MRHKRNAAGDEEGRGPYAMEPGGTCLRYPDEGEAESEGERGAQPDRGINQRGPFTEKERDEHTEKIRMPFNGRAFPIIWAARADVYRLPGRTGQGGWSWYTGSAAWMYRAWIEEVLGLKVRGDRMRLDPVEGKAFA